MLPLPRALLSILLASLLLTIVLAVLFLGVALWLHATGRLEAGELAVVRTGLSVLFLVVVAKGLLPELLLASLLRPLLASLLRSLRGREPSSALSLAVACAGAHAAVAPLLLHRQALGLPALQAQHVLQHVGNLTLMAGGVAAALWSAEHLTRRWQAGELRPPARIR